MLEPRRRSDGQSSAPSAANAVLIVAGLSQVSTLKARCLWGCRLRCAHLRRHYQHCTAGAFRLGVGHGLCCLGCCWALVLVTFAAGSATLTWMAPIMLLMVFEKTGKGRNRVVVPLGALVLARPAWLPPPFPG